MIDDKTKQLYDDLDDVEKKEDNEKLKKLLDEIDELGIDLPFQYNDAVRENKPIKDQIDALETYKDAVLKPINYSKRNSLLPLNEYVKKMEQYFAKKEAKKFWNSINVT